MILIPLGVVWFGYTMGWYGLAMLKGPGVGFADLLIPSRGEKVLGIMKMNSAGTPFGDSPAGDNTTGPGPSGTNPFTGGSGGPLLPPGLGNNNGMA